MKYSAIFIDIDDTLLDYVPCCREAFVCAIHAIEKEYRVTSYEEQLFELFFSISGRLFSEAKRGLHTIGEVMELYPAEFIRRMGEVTGEPVREEMQASMTDTFKLAFRTAWGMTHTLVQGTRETLEALQTKGYRLFAASNSFGHLQRSRLEQAGILPFFEDTYISMDIGYDKPDARYYEESLRRCGLQPKEVLMVGDSMTTDIIGAQAIGMDAIYFNRRNEPLAEGRSPLAVITSLPELLNYV